MSAVADKLREAKALIERGWTRNNYATDETGRSVDFLKCQATSFCAAGAVGAANKHWPSTSLPGMKELSLAIGGDGDEADILNWNDAKSRTKRQVIAAFDKAIELAESAQ